MGSWAWFSIAELPATLRPLLPGLISEVAGNRGQSILQCPAKLTRVQLHKRASRKDLPCSLLPAVRMCMFSYVRAVSQAVPDWSTARNFLALRRQRDFITLRFLFDLCVSSWKVWNQTRDDSTYCWKTTQRVVSTFHPTRLYCFVFAPSLFVFIRHTGLSSMFILRWIQQWGILNSKLNPGEVQLYKRCWNQEPIWWNVYFINFFWSILRTSNSVPSS